MLSPSVQKTIAEIPQLFRDNLENRTALVKMQLEHHGATAAKATMWVSIMTVSLAVIVVVPTGLLTWAGKLSPDAATFLFGAIVGAAFTFLRDFFPRAE